MLDPLGVAAKLQVGRSKSIRREHVIEKSMAQTRSRDQKLVNQKWGDKKKMTTTTTTTTTTTSKTTPKLPSC